MKKILTLIIVAGLALTIQAQNITNTLPENGLFKIIDSQGDNFFTADESTNEVLVYGWMTIGEEESPGSTLDVRGSISLNLSTGSAGFTLGNLDCIFLLNQVDGTVTLPDATNMYGRIYIIKFIGTGTATVNTTGSQTIDGDTTYSLTQHKYVQVISDGANWFIIGQN